MKNSKFYFDTTYVGKILKKYNSLKKSLKIIILIALIVFFIFLYFLFSVYTSKSRFERYINAKTNNELHQLFFDTIKIKYLIEKILVAEGYYSDSFIIEKENINNNKLNDDYLQILYSTNRTGEVLKDLKQTFNTAFNETGPNKIINFIENFLLFLKELYNQKFYENTNFVLSKNIEEKLLFYNNFFNLFLFEFYKTLLEQNEKDNNENVLRIIKLNYKNLVLLQESYLNVYGSKVFFDGVKEKYLNLFSNIEFLVSQSNIK